MRLNRTRRVLLLAWMIPVTWTLVAAGLFAYYLYAYSIGLAGEIQKEIRWRRLGLRARWLVVRRPITYKASTNQFDMVGRVMPGLVSESYLAATIGRAAISAGLENGSLQDTGRHHYAEPWGLNTYTGKSWP